MKNRTFDTARVINLASPDFERAHKLIMISLGVWICIGVLAAIHGTTFA
jgi:hypothetical protein